MTVWKIVRGAWTLISLPFVAIATLNIERIAQAHRLDQIIPDPGQKLSPLHSPAQQPWIVFLSVLIVGVTIGLWVDSALRRLLSRNIPSRKDKLTSLGYRMQNLLHRINDFHNYTLSRDRELKARLLNADLNVLLTDTARMGIPTPHADSTMDQVEDYFARVGARLVAGDETAAVHEATR
ncbi:MAG: hypothetical protein KAG62_09800 [Caulobacter sp.]|nr:hypothetical protein [Caulobacter sp.]